MSEPRYGLTRNLGPAGFEDVRRRVAEALGKEGFGVITEIDVQETLKRKLGADFRRYLILGACNPALAQQALGADPAIGLLLPCNVVLYENDDREVVVHIGRPTVLFEVVEHPRAQELARDVEGRMERAIAAI
jgi:uncharacterized protein (DUF302 family)